MAATAERPDFRPRDCPRLHPRSNISERGAQRWVKRRVEAVHAGLAVLVTLLPQLASSTPPPAGAVRAALGVAAALVALRVLAAAELSAVPVPIGFQPRFWAENRAGRENTHNSGLSPPDDGAAA